MQQLIFVTNTEGKVKEAQIILGSHFKLIHEKFDTDEIQAIQGVDVIKKKAQEAFAHFKKSILLEDTSLYFNAWNGLPGALVRWFLDAVDCDGICKMMHDFTDRSAYAESVVAIFDGKELITAEGRVKGTIPDKPRGKLGFGWDPIFVPEGHDKTFGEMTSEEKSRISMRKLAFEKLRKRLT